MRRAAALLVLAATVFTQNPAHAKLRPPVLRRFEARYNPTTTTTFYVASANDPEGSSLVYQWSLTAKCGFLIQPRTTNPSNGYQHGPPARKPSGCPIPDETAAVITVKITDGEGCAIQYSQGARDERIHLNPVTAPVRCSAAGAPASKGFPAGLLLFVLILVAAVIAFVGLRRRAPAPEPDRWDRRSEPGWQPTDEPKPALTMIEPTAPKDEPSTPQHEELFAPPREIRLEPEPPVASPPPSLEPVSTPLLDEPVSAPLEIEPAPAGDSSWPEPVVLASVPAAETPATDAAEPEVRPETLPEKPKPARRRSFAKLFSRLPAPPATDSPGDGAPAKEPLALDAVGAAPCADGAVRNETNDVVEHDTVLAGPVLAQVHAGADPLRHAEIPPGTPGDAARLLDGLTVSADAPLFVEVEIPLRLVTVVQSRREICRDGTWTGDVRSATHDGPERTERLRARVTARADLEAFVDRVVARRLGSLVEARRRLETTLARAR